MPSTNAGAAMAAEIEAVPSSPVTVEPSAPELDLGSVPAAPPIPRAVAEEYQWKRYLKRTQIIILLVLIGTLFSAMLFEFAYALVFDEKRQLLNEVMAYVIPIFTFLLGMGAQSREPLD